MLVIYQESSTRKLWNVCAARYSVYL